MAAWNATSTDTRYAQLTQTSASTPIAIASTQLQTQTITESGVHAQRDERGDVLGRHDGMLAAPARPRSPSRTPWAG